MVSSLKVRFDFFLWPLFFPPEKKRKSEKENERERKRERGRAKQSLDPALLLDHLAALEGQHGRPARRAHHAPRPLDLDILYAGHLVQHTARLTVPHPRLARRRFVLQPLADLRPQLLLPGHSRTIAQLLAALPPDPAVQLFAPAW